MMPAGTYYIGDLCYVMTDKEWDIFCSITTKGMECLSGEFTMPDGRRFASYTTKYGDGEYFDQLGNSYSVDAGLIGCIRLDDICDEKRIDAKKLKRLGNIRIFSQDFVTSSPGNGKIHIGSVVIDTDDVDDYE
jgi:hypothetical protein